jgi:hypothetical protein
VSPTGIARQAYSQVAVDIAAPNTALIPPKNGTRPVTGADSSIAAPYFSGIAALVKSLNPTWWTFDKIRAHIMESGTRLPDLQNKNRSGMIVSARDAVLGPIRLSRPRQGLIWSSTNPVSLNWTMRYPSTFCTELQAEYQPENTDSWFVIGRGSAIAMQMMLTLTNWAGTAGKVRIRSLGSEFHSAVLNATVR